MDAESQIYLGYDSPNADHVCISILRRSHPEATDYWDGNWISAEIELVAGAFKGGFTADLRCEEMEQFKIELSNLYEAAEGNAVLETMEGQLSLTLTRIRIGHIQVNGKAMDQAGIGNSVQFHFEIDQSFLPRTIRQLEAVLCQYPTI